MSNKKKVHLPELFYFFEIKAKLGAQLILQEIIIVNKGE
jgi:hypothetical protein